MIASASREHGRDGVDRGRGVVGEQCREHVAEQASEDVDDGRRVRRGVARGLEAHHLVDHDGQRGGGLKQLGDEARDRAVPGFARGQGVHALYRR